MKSLVALLLLTASCGYSEMEMQVQRDHAAMLKTALERLQEHYMQCEDLLVKELQDKQSAPR